ncbi:efflux RND transporter permease subunit [Pseudomonas aeruginosa]
MREVTGPIIATAPLVLCAVFTVLRWRFISGVTGQFYKQFAVTIAISTVISPAHQLADAVASAGGGLLLRPPRRGRRPPTRLFIVKLSAVWLFRPFNRFLPAPTQPWLSAAW